MRLLALFVAALAACSSSGVRSEPIESPPDAAASPSDGGVPTPITKSPGSSDGGVSAPCTDTSNCHVGLECIDGACFG